MIDGLVELATQELGDTDLADPDPDITDLEAKFHSMVQSAVDQTLEVFKDDDLVMSRIKMGDYEGVHYLCFQVVHNGHGAFGADAVLEASEDGEKGLQMLAMDAALYARSSELTLMWYDLIAARRIFSPEIDWPVIKLGKPAKMRRSKAVKQPKKSKKSAKDKKSRKKK